MYLIDPILRLLYQIVPSPIFRAIEEGRVDDVRDLMAFRYHLLSKDRWGNLPIMIAIREKQSDIALAMLKLGVPATYRSKHGASPLSFAAMMGDLSVGAALIDSGADVDERLSDPDGAYINMTPLMWAVNRRHAAFVKLLLERGANVDVTNGQNQTALMFAVDGTPECNTLLDILLGRLPDPQILYIRDWRGRTLIDEARDRARNSGLPQMGSLITTRFPNVSLE